MTELMQLLDHALQSNLERLQLWLQFLGDPPRVRRGGNDVQDAMLIEVNQGPASPSSTVTYAS
jgi:hypothetical protein